MRERLLLALVLAMGCRALREGPHPNEPGDASSIDRWEAAEEAVAEPSPDAADEDTSDAPRDDVAEVTTDTAMDATEDGAADARVDTAADALADATEDARVDTVMDSFTDLVVDGPMDAATDLHGDVSVDSVRCSGGRTLCGTDCRSLESDHLNCGACARRCAVGNVCSRGECTALCALGPVRVTGCSGDCVSVMSDRDNCGSCETRCPVSEVCGRGLCAPSCGVGLSDCSGICRDLNVDPRSCGGCDNRCPGGQVCARGACASGCPSGTAMCLDRCVDTLNDSDNCGACALQCVPGGYCASGVCTVPNPQVSCTVPGTPGCGLEEVLGGSFTLGGDPMAYGALLAVPSVSVSSFAIDRYEVTVARFRAFWARRIGALSSLRRTPLRYPNGQTIAWEVTAQDPLFTETNRACNFSPGPSSRDTHPMNCQDWWLAQEFCAWDGGRLPTEAEWEFVARGRVLGSLLSGRSYPWGEEPPRMPCVGDRAHWGNCGGQDGALTQRVGQFPRGTSGGVFDLCGNVWELTADAFTTNDSLCWRAGPLVNPLCTASITANRTLRGGGFSYTDLSFQRAAVRGEDMPLNRDPNTGFRCARSR